MTPIQGEPTTSLEPYRTSDTPFAAYLHYCGYKLAGTKQDPNDYKREVVVFIFDDDIPKHEESWRLSKAEGDLKKYHRSLKIVNRFVNEARKKREE